MTCRQALPPNRAAKPRKSGRALSVHIYDLALNVANGAPMASSSALVLLAVIFVVNAAAVTLAESWLRRRLSFS